MICLNTFSDIESGRLPERCFTLKIFSTHRTSEFNQLIYEAREHKSIVNTDNPEGLIEMNGEIKKREFFWHPSSKEYVNLILIPLLQQLLIWNINFSRKELSPEREERNQRDTLQTCTLSLKMMKKTKKENKCQHHQ